MRRFRFRDWLTVCWLLSVASATYGAELSFNDIEFWTGSGSNRTGVAIDWDGDNLGDANAPSFAWGYRWDGNATVEDALRAVLSNDDRLFAKLSTSGTYGVTVYGLGYDLADDGSFALDDLTVFGTDGVAITGPSDGASSVDPLDSYREGWQAAGYWHLSTTESSLSVEWTTARSGITTLALNNDGWVGLAFTPSFSNQAFPNNLSAAEVSPLSGDFNLDGAVNLADYTVWRDSLNDPALYQIWKDNFGSANLSATRASIAVPQPKSIRVVILMGSVLLARRLIRSVLFYEE